MAGIALYWGEGSKNCNRLQITNSDPKIIIFFIIWVQRFFKIEKRDLICSISVNIIHKDRIKEIEKYWSQEIGIPLEQFRKTVLLSTKNKKNYSNFKKHFGTLRITVRKSSNLLYVVQGAIEGMI